MAGAGRVSFFEELRRRNVFRVGTAYVISSWVLLQFADLVLENIQAPDWIIKVFMLGLAIGFPLAVFFAWAFEMTPEGIKKEKDVDRTQSITPTTGRKLDRSIIVVLLIAVVYFAWDNFAPEKGSISLQSNQGTEISTTGELNQAPAEKKSIAVLPFADLSQAQDQEWFADGLAEEILNALAKTPDLLVSSRTSSFRYKGSTLDLPDIANELGVAHILEGSVRSSGNRIRVTAQLIRANDGFHVWSENYDRDIADMIEIQEDLALNIANALETTMDPVALAAMISTGTRSVEAYEAYLRGLALKQESRNTTNRQVLFKESYQHFEQARSIDPNFAAAHLQAATFWRIQLTPARVSSGLTQLEPAQMLVEFNERVDLAIANAPTPVDKKGYMAYKALFELRLNESIRLYSEYLKERPNDGLARYALSDAADLTSNSDLQKEILTQWREHSTSELDDAFAYMNKAYEVIDPSQAADFGLQTLQRLPNHKGLMYQTHRTLLWAGRILEGKELADRYSRLYPEDDVLVRARQACAEGRRAEVEAIYAALDTNDNYDLSSRWHMSKLLGKEQQATDALQPYANSGVPYMLTSFLVYISFDPSPFPEVMAVLDREGVNRPPPVEIPFKCPPPEQTSIAVLPFVNMSADAENEFFSDGISEEILNVLASIPDLKVAARTSAFAFKGTNTKISQIAKELGVNHVLEGSVRKSGNQVRVTAQLIKADDGFHLWSDNYDRELTNIFAIQDEIAGSIAQALKVSLKLATGSAGNLTGTNSIEAYEHYLKGMSLWHLRTVGSLRESIEEFEKAIVLDPKFAKAHAGLALTWAIIADYVSMDGKAAIRNASQSANSALSIDPNNVEAVTALAQVALKEFRYKENIDLLQRAVALNPSFATAHQWLGGSFAEMGDPEAGLVSLQKAWSLDPRSRIIGANMAYVLANLGRSQEAVDVLTQIVAFAPNFPDAHELLMHIAIVTGDCESALEAGNKVAKILNKQADAIETYLDLCQTDDTVLRASAIDTILKWSNSEFSDEMSPSLSYPEELMGMIVELGEFDAALKLIEKYYPIYSNFSLAWVLRPKRSKNGISFYCDSRVQSIFEQRGIPRVEGEDICD
jgi:TolB-like protein/Tfp pilus assembly protein PilF